MAAALLAVLFLAMGALVMHGSGDTFSASGIAFTRQLVQLYSATIGDWSRTLILTAAFVTMFSTTVTCTDGYPRSLAACCALIGDLPAGRFNNLLHQIWVGLVVLSSALVVLLLVKNLVQLLTFAAWGCFF